MKNIFYIIFLLIVFITVNITCKKPYNPPATQADNKFLVIDGTLISSADSPSVITLSRTTKLTDTTTSISPETVASVSVQGDDGEVISFFEQSEGVYKSNPSLLNASVKYRLNITTSGEDYASDFVEMEQTPPIDSLTWQQQNDVMIYLNTHDPSNNTRYYRWDFTEIYQYESLLQAELSQDNGRLFYVDDNDQTFDCWRTVASTDILLGSSIALSQDVISHAAINIVPQNSQKISIRYSILVKQYALTPEAYQYFSILKKNTENLGSIFDAQPSQLTGNIHSLKNPSEIVVGFFSASSVQQRRLFITKYDVNNWHFVDTTRECGVTLIGHYTLPDPGFYIWDYPDRDYYPYYVCGAGCFYIARRECVDCRVRGGVNHKPSFW